MKPMKRLTATAGAMLLLAAVVAACGDDDVETSTPPSTAVTTTVVTTTAATTATTAAPDTTTTSAAADGSVSAVLLGTFVVDSFGFHGMQEDYAEATEVGIRDAGRVEKVMIAFESVAWPAELSDPVGEFGEALAGLHAALAANDLEASRTGFEAVHEAQHGFSNAVYEWLGA